MLFLLNADKVDTGGAVRWLHLGEFITNLYNTLNYSPRQNLLGFSIQSCPNLLISLYHL